MEVKDFLLINGAILLLLVVYMKTMRSRPKRKSTINERRGRDIKEPSALSENALAVSVSQNTKQERSLNAMFMYNGEAFDAYEILGVPAGCSIQMAESAMDKGLADQEGQGSEIFRLALKAIQQLKN